MSMHFSCPVFASAEVESHPFYLDTMMSFMSMHFSCPVFTSVEVESHPFELDTMMFMDWRDEHTHSNPAMRASNEALPTFLYVMPYTKNR